MKNIRFMRFVWLLGIAIAYCNSAFAQQGVIQGSVLDAVTQEPLVGAQVIATSPKDTTLKTGAVVNADGNYIIRDLRPGIYTVIANFAGYKPLMKNQVTVEKGVTQLNFALEEVSVQTEAVEITGSAFQQSSQNLASIKTVGVEQIRSNPGGNFDISRVVQSLPGVSGSIGFRNDIIVRGGAPNENVFYLDGIEVPNINHFATQGSGGGPVGIINSLFIENVKFQSSGFSARYDNTMSSVLDFEMISGNTERLQTTFLLSATEAGITFDSPIGKKVTVLASVRRSYLQLLFQQIGLPFLPSYWDFQGKVQWKINPKTTLTYVRIGAIDRFTKNPPKREDIDPNDSESLSRLALIDGLPIFKQDSYTQGAILKRLTPRGYFTIALSRNRLDNSIVKEDTLFGPQLRTQDFLSIEAENKLRFNATSRISGWEINYGAVLQYVTYSLNSLALLGDPSSTAVVDGATLKGVRRIDAKSDIGFFRYGLYVSVSRSFLSNRLRTNVGIRTDMNSFTDKGNDPLEALSPRISLSYALSEKVRVNATTGVYYRLPSYTVLGFKPNGEAVNRTARYTQCIHYVLGAEYQPTSSWILSAEAFYKAYDRYPVSVEKGISLANLGGGFGVLGNEAIVTNGKGQAYGIETYTQKMLTRSVYGIASYTLYWSEFSGKDGRTIRSAWDNRHLISLTGGCLLGKNKSWEVAAKWRYLGPQPYTPWRTDAEAVQFYLVSGNGSLDWKNVNGAETTGFSQVDVRITKSWNFSRWSLQAFIDIQNLMGRANNGVPNFTLARDADLRFIQPARPLLLDNANGARIPSIGARVRF